MKEIVRYLICGVLTTIVSFSTFYFSTRLIGSDTLLLLQTCNVISFVCAVVFSYVLSRLWVFNHSSKNAVEEFLQFVMCRIFALAADMIIMGFLVFYVGVSDMIAKLLVQVVVTVLNYVLSRFIVFQGKGENHG